MPNQINEILQFDPTGQTEKTGRQPTQADNQVDEILKFDPGPSEGFIGETPVSSVMTPKLAEQDEPAEMWTHLKAGFVNDPLEQIPIYAASRFPELYEKNPGAAMKRYGIHRGEIVYMGDDKKLYRETPDTWWNELNRFAARMGAHIPTILFGMAGAATGGPLGAAALSAGGEGLRRIIGEKLFGADVTPQEAFIGMGVEAMLGAGGELAGRGIARYLNRAGAKRGGRLAVEAGRDRPYLDLVEAETIRRTGRRFGIDLIPPQTTESSQLISKFNLLADLPATADKIKQFKNFQMNQVDRAVYRFLDDISSARTTPYRAAKEVTEAAGEAVEGIKIARTETVAPLYQKAFESGVEVEIKPVLKTMDGLLSTTPEGSASRKALKRIQRMFYRAKKVKGKAKKVPETRLEALDNVKKEIDNILRGPEKTSIQKDVRYRLSQLKDDLTAQMDEASPDYAEARRIYGEISPPVEATQRGIVGEISRLESDKVMGAIDRLFSPKKSSPEIVKEAKSLIKAENPQAWDNLIRAYLQSTFEDIKVGVTGDISNLGGHLVKKIFGNNRQRKILEAAMEPEQFKNFTDFMDVLRRTGLVFGRESTTATRQAALKEMAERGESKILRATTRPLYTYQRIVGDKLNEVFFGNYQKQLADAMLSEKAARRLRKMKQLSPKSQELLRQASVFLSLLMGGGFAGGGPENVPPTLLEEQAAEQSTTRE